MLFQFIKNFSIQTFINIKSLIKFDEFIRILLHSFTLVVLAMDFDQHSSRESFGKYFWIQVTIYLLFSKRILKVAQVKLEVAFAKNNFVGKSAHIRHFENIKAVQIQHNVLSKSWLLKG